MIWKQVSNEKTTTKCGIMNNGLRAHQAGIAWQCAGKIDSKTEIGHYLGQSVRVVGVPATAPVVAVGALPEVAVAVAPGVLVAVTVAGVVGVVGVGAAPSSRNTMNGFLHHCNCTSGTSATDVLVGVEPGLPDEPKQAVSNRVVVSASSRLVIKYKKVYFMPLSSCLTAGVWLDGRTDRCRGLAV